MFFFWSFERERRERDEVEFFFFTVIVVVAGDEVRREHFLSIPSSYGSPALLDTDRRDRSASQRCVERAKKSCDERLDSPPSAASSGVGTPIGKFSESSVSLRLFVPSSFLSPLSLSVCACGRVGASQEHVGDQRSTTLSESEREKKRERKRNRIETARRESGFCVVCFSLSLHPFVTLSSARLPQPFKSHTRFNFPPLHGEGVGMKNLLFS